MLDFPSALSIFFNGKILSSKFSLETFRNVWKHWMGFKELDNEDSGGSMGRQYTLKVIYDREGMQLNHSLWDVS